MERFYILVLLVLLLSLFALGSTNDFDEGDGNDSDEDEDSNYEGRTIFESLLSLIPILDMSKKPKKNCDKKNKKPCEEERGPDEELSPTRPTSRTTTESSSAATSSRSTSSRTSEPSSPALTSRWAMSTTSEPSPPSSAPLSSSVAIFFPVTIILFLLVLLAAFLLWKYSHYFQCWRRLGGKDDTVKMKSENNEVAIRPPVSHLPGSEDQAQLPPTGHFYQEISDVRMEVPGPDASYSTVGFPYHDQKAADKQPPDGQYSLLRLSSQ